MGQTVLPQSRNFRPTQRSGFWILMTALVVVLCSVTQPQPLLAVTEQAGSSVSWNFDEESAGTLPKRFMVGTLFDGRPAGKWTVTDMKRLPGVLENLDRRELRRVTNLIDAVSAPSPPHVLAQLMNKGFEHDYKVVLVEGTTAKDLELEVSFLAVAGKGDMGGGLVWRATNDRNYYLTRANPLEQNIRLYRVVNGVRKELANFDQIISVDRWHKLRVLARGDRFQVFYDGEAVLDVRDTSLKSEGMVGLWTKADAVTYFDDLRVSIMR